MLGSSLQQEPSFNKLLEVDPNLEPNLPRIADVYDLFRQTWNRLSEASVGFEGYKEFGIIVQTDNSVRCREWAPNLSKLSLAGDFNDWTRDEYEFSSVGEGIWELVIPPNSDKTCKIPHLTDLRLFCTDKQGHAFDRISPWSKYVTQRDKRIYYNETFYNPDEGYSWLHERPKAPRVLYIYESHVGISSSEPKISTYLEFADNIIPRIAKLGYNTIQLMAVMEHAYYASFGYQVTSFFAPSSRFGTPDELKYLIDKAHKHGILVLLDLVHSHASNNTIDGLNSFDGSDTHYFLQGDSGRHSQWNSRLFDYTKKETLSFLLSNLQYWLDIFRFDGFRFDGITSMLYHHHGISYSFSGSYNEYFNHNLNMDAVVYMMIANSYLHEKYPSLITIAEDVSGYPGLCLPVQLGGVGFDYRLAMSVPDMWIKLLKESKSDAEWDMGHIAYTLNNRRHKEKTIAYVESHDQALVGDKTIAFWLMDSEMYTNMSELSPMTPRIERGIALHKMLRLITFSLAGEGILTFMGNEFGHPEWLDFPRVGNNESYQYCRRQYNLIDDDMLRYKFLNRFDGFILEMESKYHWLDQPNAYIYLCHESDKIISYVRGSVCFVFNFNWESFSDYRIQVTEPGKYKVVIDSDHRYFGGQGRININTEHFSYSESDKVYIKTYLPSRTALAYRIDID